jgi:glycerol kinase
MSRPVVLAIDQGTTSVRASLVGADLEVGATRAAEIERSFPKPGWVELDAEEVVRATERVAAEVLSGVRPSDVAAWGLANQGETIVVWERASGRPIAPAIVWQCRRTEPACARLHAGGHAAWIEEATGLPVDPYFSATKIAWLLDAVPGARARAERGELVAGTLDTFTLFRLSRGRLLVTDPSTACRTQLAELATGRFSERLCEIFGVPRAMLAEVVASDADLGPVSIAGVDLPLRALLCDQPSALLGTGCVAPGDVKCTYGTGAFLQVSTGSAPASGRDGLLRSIAWELSGARSYLLEGSVLAAGDVLTWLRDGLGMLARPDEVDAILRDTPDSAGVLFVPALTGLGAPRWASGARGAVLGLHRGVRREQLLRAALEGIAHQVADVLAVARRAITGELSPMWADGGLASSREFLALQADLMGAPLRVAERGEATTRGVAAVAAVAAGLAPSIEALVARQPTATITPRMSDAARDRARERHARLLDLVTSEDALGLTHDGEAPL